MDNVKNVLGVTLVLFVGIPLVLFAAYINLLVLVENLSFAFSSVGIVCLLVFGAYIAYEKFTSVAAKPELVSDTNAANDNEEMRHVR